MNNGRYDLTYFTHEVGGMFYGGWFRVTGESIEVFSQATTRVRPLCGAVPELAARLVLEGIINEKLVARASHDRE